MTGSTVTELSALASRGTVDNLAQTLGVRLRQIPADTDWPFSIIVQPEEKTCLHVAGSFARARACVAWWLNTTRESWTWKECFAIADRLQFAEQEAAE